VNASPTMVQKLAASVPQALAMLAAMELDVFTPLAEAPRTADELARALDVRSEMLLPLLRVLVSTGLLCSEAERFKNSAEATQFLVRGQPGYMGGVHELWNDLWQAELHTARSVRSGVPQVIHDYAATSTDEIRALLRGLRSGSVAAARALMGARDLSRIRRLLDVGGGPGGLALTLAERFPQMCATVLELPVVAPLARQFVEASSCPERVDVVALDIVREVPGGAYDLAVCNRFIQVLAPADAARAIANVAMALEPGGAIYIMGHILDDSGFSPAAAVSYGLFALNVFRGGQAFTEQQHRQWLNAADLVNITRELLPNGYSLMSARKQ